MPGRVRLSETPQRPRGGPFPVASLGPVQFLRVGTGGRDYWPEAPPVPCSPPLPQALIVVYAFHFPHLLNPQMERAAHRGLYRRHILGIVLRGPALCFVAAGFSLFFCPLVSGGQGAGKRDCPTEQMPPGGGGRAVQRSQEATGMWPGARGAGEHGWRESLPPHPSPQHHTGTCCADGQVPRSEPGLGEDTHGQMGAASGL